MIKLTVIVPPRRYFPQGEYVDVVGETKEIALLHVAFTYGIAVEDIQIHREGVNKKAWIKASSRR